MKILLVSINSQYIHSNLANLYILANFSAEADIQHFEFSLKDTYANIFDKLVNVRPDLLAFSVYVWNVELIKALVIDLKKLLPDTMLLLGGPEADYNYRDMLRTWPVDFIYRGEGDRAFSDFISSLQSGNALPDFVATPGHPEARQTFTLDLERLISPYSIENVGHYQNRLLYYETSRGCPFACTYCLSSATHGVRYFNLERLEQDFRLFILNGVKTVKLVDRTFNLPESRAIKILNLIQDLTQHYAGQTVFHLELVADQLSDKFLELLSTMPLDLVQVEIGIQSVHEKTLTAIQRQVNQDKLFHNINRILAMKNIHVHLDLILGLPYESMTMFAQSFNRVMAMNPHHFQLGILKQIHGSVLSQQDQHGMVFSAKPPYELYQNHFLSYREIAFAKNIERLVDRYYNSGRFFYTWKYLVDISFGTPYAMCAALVRYFDVHIPAESSFAARPLFYYLYDFIVQMQSPDESFLINVLAFDYLLQERPKFFPDWLPHKRDKRLFELVLEQGDILKTRGISREKCQEKLYTTYLNLGVCRRETTSYSLTPSEQPRALFFYYPDKKNRLEINEVGHLEFQA